MKRKFYIKKIIQFKFFKNIINFVKYLLCSMDCPRKRILKIVGIFITDLLKNDSVSTNKKIID